MRRAFYSLLIILFLSVMAHAQAADVCRITGTGKDISGRLVSNVRIRITPVTATGTLVSSASITATFDSNGVLRDKDGNAYQDLLQGATVNISGPVLNYSGSSGQNVTIPSTGAGCTADLYILTTVSTFPSTGATVYEESTTLSGLFGTFKFVGSGVTATRTSAGIVTVTVPGGSGSSALDDLTDVAITTPASAQVLRYNGSLWVNSAIQAADLPTGIDVAKLGGGLVSNAEFGYLDGASSNLQTQINARLTQAAADALYSALNHNHSGVYEPANANIQSHVASTSNPHSVTKSQVGLGNAENTALSTWAGTSNITTVGAIGTGTWQGSQIADAYIASASAWNAKQAALGFTAENVANKATGFGTLNNTLYPTVQAVANYAQPLSSVLNIYAGINPSANVQTLLGAADYSAFRSSLGLVIGTNVQAFSARLSEVAAIGSALQQVRVNAAGNALEYFTASGGGGSPGGSPGEVQVNISGAFGSDSTFLFDPTDKNLALTSAPPASASKSLLRLGSAISGGNSNGTYLSINTSGAYAGDVINLQRNGNTFFSMSNTGVVLLGASGVAHGALAFADNGSGYVLGLTSNGSGLWYWREQSVTGNRIVNFDIANKSVHLGHNTSPSGTYTLEVFDATGSTGVTTQSIKAGAGQSSNDLLKVLDNSDALKWAIDSSFRMYFPAGATSSTVGSAGGASALPATPTGYIIVNVNGASKKLPYYDN